MELSCPSCSSKHRSEDYPGAFEIQCACGYALLVPDETSLQAPLAAEEDPAPLPDFDGAPMAQEHHNEMLISPNSDAPAASDESLGFSALNLTAPENLPEGMPYDAFELDTQWKSESPEPDPATKAAPAPAPKISEEPKPVVAQDIVNRIQMASIGHMHGALFDLELGEIPSTQLKSLSERCQKVLDERPWLRALVARGFDAPEELIRQKKIRAVPELLAVEIYLHCAQNAIACELRAHRS